MTTTNAYDVIYHYEVGGKGSGSSEHVQVAAADASFAAISTAIKNSTQYKASMGTLVIDNIKNIGGGPLQQ